MQRLFGTSKPKAPKPTLQDAIRSNDQRIESVDVKIRKLDGELARYGDQLSKMRDGPAKRGLKQQALQVLKQKKMYEAQRQQITQTSFNMEQASFVTDNLRNTLSTIDAMKTANEVMKKEYKSIDIDKIYDVQDEMMDLMEAANEVQDALSRSYAVPDEMEDLDLEAELEALEMDWDNGINTGSETVGSIGAPSYLGESGIGALPELVPEESTPADTTGEERVRIDASGNTHTL
ncbi:hypothetical protein GQ42DRAFT_160522 [Ramicandelaber brevisporus]|nr:hypothetical protein GQ42DRAFT_160522 [Ramicandelaber brevisporus]